MEYVLTGVMESGLGSLAQGDGDGYWREKSKSRFAVYVVVQDQE